MAKKKLNSQELYPIEDWKYDVSNGDTKLGYEDWVEHNVESHQKMDDDIKTEKEYTVTVTRISYGYITISVKAPSKKEARKQALDEAGNHEFSEHSADYEIDGIRLAINKHTFNPAHLDKE